MGSFPTDADDASLSREERTWLEAFDAYVTEHLADPTLSVPIMADFFHLSESTLLRKVKRYTGATPLQYLLTKRLHHAYQLLSQPPSRTVKEVGEAVGYLDPESFARRFKAYFGVPPSDVNPP